ncbi:hypothetical protein COX09_04500 [Candidatus Beckwithbacteria bacterium CG23_combo_of_CG06-09_8_20_14_all_47_9]|uniref:Uncharacterized protein n=1 Tax=Candidatus Beckwithbacteria bacterium CG23_combo_of_CG06-09_8_20_14_all_47_9 TaxID=1974498 RepID=A0A2H0B2N0_9BACT|nr:MAG: hypothetical protein COX09_04500 [Candidatus Beckwithbacteria bacterium CG23_combo_of_CG06-09_8_20_14_all_47_9]
MKRHLLFILITAAALLWIPFSRAADQTITCTDSGCSGISDALFNEAGVAPGESVTKSLEIINNHSQTLKLALDPSQNTGTDTDFIESVTVTVTTDKGSRFTGTLGQFLTAYIDLEKLESGQRRPVEIALSLADAGNEFQGKQAKFSFDLKIDQEVPGEAASPSPSPAAGLVAGAQTELAGAFIPEESPSPGPEAGPEILGETTPAGRDWRRLWLSIPLLILWLWRIRHKPA